MTYAITPSYLMDSGYLENVIISEFEDGTPFAIFEDWDDVGEVNYAVIEKIVPEALLLYEEAGLIKPRRWSNNKMIGEIKIDGEVPEIVLDAFANTEIKYYDIIESALGCEWGFSDEYTTCSDCGKVIRTSPDSYGWQPDFHIGDGYIACKTCFDNTPEYQEEYIENKINNPKSAVNGIMSESQIEELGFVKLNEKYQNGWYNRNDNPEEIYNIVSERFDEVLFFIDSIGQFHIDFAVFVRGELGDE